jgi:hypothetical protein
VFEQVLPPDVQDEDERRPQGRDEREVLLGADADVDAARLHPFAQVVQDVQETAFVRDEVFDRERAARFGQAGRERGKRLVGQSLS